MWHLEGNNIVISVRENIQKDNYEEDKEENGKMD